MMKRAETNFNSALDAEMLADITVIAVAKIGRASVDGARFAADMLEEYGEYVRPYLDKAFAAARAQVDNVGKELPEKTRKAVRKAIAKDDLVGNRAAIVDRLKSRAAEGSDLRSTRAFVQSLALNFVKSGIRDTQPLIDAVHGVMQEIYPDITKGQTRAGSQENWN